MKVTIQIDALLLRKLRDKGFPYTAALSDEEIVLDLIQKELGPAAVPAAGEKAPDPGGPEQPKITTGCVWVNAEMGLNVRAEPISGEVLEVTPHLSELLVLDMKANWIQVRTPTGVVGWVSQDYVLDEKPSRPPKGNVRGIHGAAGMAAPPPQRWADWIRELKEMGMAWYKQLDAGDPNDVGAHSTFAWARELKRNGIEPIIRYYQGQMFPGRLNTQTFGKIQRYAAEGIVWCEIGNEPNLDHAEWHSEHHGKLNFNNPYYPATIVENWINDAEKVVAAGGRPGFYAFAPTDWGGGQHPSLSSVMFYQRSFAHVAANPNLLSRYRRIFEPGKAWLSVHVSTYEFPPDFDPWPSGKPPWDMCLRGYEIPLRYMRDILGIDEPIVMSTEGGVFCKDSSSMGGHERLRSHQEHAAKTVEMFDYIQNRSPLQAMCPWLICNVFGAIGHSDGLWAHDGWFDGEGAGFNPKPVVQAIKASKPNL